MNTIIGKIICKIRGYHKWYDGKCKTCGTSLLRTNESFKVVGHMTIPATELDIVPRVLKTSPTTTCKHIDKAPLLKNQLMRNAIPELNKKRNQQSTYAHAKHFKRRQPTTARKLWNPRARPEQEEND